MFLVVGDAWLGYRQHNKSMILQRDMVVLYTYDNNFHVGMNLI